MTAAKVRQVASMLANSCWVRYWLVLGFPNRPYGGCIQMRDHKGRVMHPNNKSAGGRLCIAEMERDGFRWQNRYGVLGWHADIDEETVYSPMLPQCDQVRDVTKGITPE